MKILMVLISVCLVYLVEWADPNWKTYYFLLGVSSFVSVFACTWACKKRRFKDCILIFGYSLIHFLFLCLYITMTTREGFNYLSYLFFDSSYSLSNFIFYYELLMISSGILDGLRFLGNRYYYGGLVRHIDRQFYTVPEG